MEHPVARARKQKEMSQAALARACGVNRSTICRVEKGERSSFQTFRLIGRALDMDYRMLIPEEGPQ